jgi:hypothetical protein
MCTVPHTVQCYIGKAINEIKENLKTAVKVHGEKISMLCFADDMAIIAESKEDLTRL